MRSPSIGLRYASSMIACASSTRICVAGGSISTTSGCTPRSARSHERSSSSGAIDRGREAARRLLHARAARPDEQVRVHRALGGALQQRDRAVLADDPGPVLGRRHRAGHPASSGSTARPDALGDRVDVAVAVDHAPSRALGASVAVRARAPRRGTSAPSRLEPVGLRRPARAAATASDTSSTTHEVGLETAGRDRVQLLDRRRRRGRARRPGTRATTGRSGRTRPTRRARARARSRSATCCARSAAISSASAAGATGSGRGAAARGSPRRSRRRPGSNVSTHGDAARAQPARRAAPPACSSRCRHRPRARRSGRGSRRRSGVGLVVGRRSSVGVAARSARPSATARRARAADRLDGPVLGGVARRLAARSAPPADRPPREEPGDERDEPAAPQRDAHTRAARRCTDRSTTVWSVEQLAW